MHLGFSYDSSVNRAPNGFISALDKVKQFFENTFSDPVSLNIAVGYGEVNGHALASGVTGESSLTMQGYSYSQIKQALSADAKSALDASAVSSLPAFDPTGGGPFYVSLAEAKALGLAGSSGQDGAVGFSSSVAFDFDNSDGVDTGKLDFFGVVAHEVSEIMGRFLLDGENGYAPGDLFHFSSQGARSFSPGGYFSVDDGATNLGTFNSNTSGDLGDWASSVGADSFLAFAQAGTVLPVSANDIKVMDALGWDVAGTSGGATPTTPSNPDSPMSSPPLSYVPSGPAGLTPPSLPAIAIPSSQPVFQPVSSIPPALPLGYAPPSFPFLPVPLAEAPSGPGALVPFNPWGGLAPQAIAIGTIVELDADAHALPKISLHPDGFIYHDWIPL